MFYVDDAGIRTSDDIVVNICDKPSLTAFSGVMQVCQILHANCCFLHKNTAILLLPLQFIQIPRVLVLKVYPEVKFCFLVLNCLPAKYQSNRSKIHHLQVVYNNDRQKSN